MRKQGQSEEPAEQKPQENPFEESAEKTPRSKRSISRSNRLRVEAFVRAYATPTSPEYLNATKAAIAAGYSPISAASQASRLLKKPRVKELIERATSEIAEKLTTAGVVDVAFIERQHLEAMARCRIAGDRTNEREHLECLGKMKGAYDVSLHLDLTVKHEYDERLAIEASRLARLALEEAGAGPLGLPEPAAPARVRIEVEQAPDAEPPAAALLSGDGHPHTEDWTEPESAAAPAAPEDGEGDEHD